MPANALAAQENDLVDFIAGFTSDPLGYVYAAFEWGRGELVGMDGPMDWQADVLGDIGARLRRGISQQEAIQTAVASGHGVGKSALVAWLILWALSTHEDTKGVVTANTENQLKTKTWAELAKWYRLSINADWFQFTATAIFSRSRGHEKTWRIDMVPWSENNTEAFAGLHNQGKRLLLVMDEASAIPDKIWEVSEGTLTDVDTQIIWCCFGNPTRNVGRFYECFNKFSHRWQTRSVDSRTVPITNKGQIEKWREDYGEDSDFFRVRVSGIFPRGGINALLGPADIEAAVKREYIEREIAHFPVVLGVDVARQGDDSSVIARRQGVVAFPMRAMKIPDTTVVGAQVAQEYDKCGADAMFVDATGGYGAGVVDGIKGRGYAVIEVLFGGRANDALFFNKRSEMWFEMAQWVKDKGSIPDDPELKEELLVSEFFYQGDKFRLISKEDMKKQLGRSPDKADALALTFAQTVRKKKDQREYGAPRAINYDPYDHMKGQTAYGY